MNKNPLEFMLSPEITEGAGAEYRTCFTLRDVLTDLSSDFTLPDYYPEIRKLLRIETNISPAGRYIGGGSVEFSGRVDHDMIYVTADGGVASAPLGSDFSFEVPISLPDSATENSMLEAIADSEAENVNGRVMSPRKVNVKCRLRSKVRCYCASEYAPEIDGGQRIERLTEEIVCADSRRYVGEEISLSAEIPCDTEDISPLYGRTETLSVSRQSVSKWETDGATPDLDKLLKLSQLFGITLDELVTGESAPLPEPELQSEPEPKVIYVERTEPTVPKRKIAGYALFGMAILVVLLCQN